MAPAMTPDFRFKTSSYTEANGTCVEVALAGEFAAVRDTKNRSGGHITVSGEAFAAFLAAVVTPGVQQQRRSARP